MTRTNRCAGRGWVTGPAVPMPVGPHAYAWVGEPAPPTPCTRLVCTLCGHPVRSRDGWFLDAACLASGPPVVQWLSGLHDAATWTDQPASRVRPGREFRAYLRCCTLRCVLAGALRLWVPEWLAPTDEEADSSGLDRVCPPLPAVGAAP